MTYYEKHIFFCTNSKKESGGCSAVGGDIAFAFAKEYLQSLNRWGHDRIGVSKSGCLGRCIFGPTCVVYPDNVWYSYTSKKDIKRIIDQHLINGCIVYSLKLL